MRRDIVTRKHTLHSKVITFSVACKGKGLRLLSMAGTQHTVYIKAGNDSASARVRIYKDKEQWVYAVETQPHHWHNFTNAVKAAEHARQVINGNHGQRPELPLSQRLQSAHVSG